MILKNQLSFLKIAKERYFLHNLHSVHLITIHLSAHTLDFLHLYVFLAFGCFFFTRNSFFTPAGELCVRESCH